MTNNAFFDSFKARSFIMYSNPIRVALYERKMTLKELVEILAKKGFIYDYHLLCVVVRGKAHNHFTLHYFTHIYRVLNLPMPTPEYLYQSYLRWEDIKSIKLEQRNANRIKRGLLPVDSLSTRIK